MWTWLLLPLLWLWAGLCLCFALWIVNHIIVFEAGFRNRVDFKLIHAERYIWAYSLAFPEAISTLIFYQGLCLRLWCNIIWPLPLLDGLQRETCLWLWIAHALFLIAFFSSFRHCCFSSLHFDFVVGFLFFHFRCMIWCFSGAFLFSFLLWQQLWFQHDSCWLLINEFHWFRCIFFDAILCFFLL